MIRCCVLAASLMLPLPSHATLVTQQAQLLQTAEQGLAQTQASWWNAGKGWYKGDRQGDIPVASLWSSYPLLELTAAIAIADPTAANKARVDTIFTKAEQFWDSTLDGGAGGVSWLWGLRDTWNGFFDDTGWWGLAYLDAYRATGKSRWLWDAGRALNHIDRFGWDKASGGTWWDDGHDHKTSEPLGAATLIAATLYRIQHKKYYYDLATKYIAWADAHTVVDGLYGRSATDDTAMDYVEGMMIGAEVQLCRATKKQSWCVKAEQLASASVRQFPTPADWAPETDVVYMHGLLDLYSQDGDANWYSVVYANGQAALANAKGPDGFWSQTWTGGFQPVGLLHTQAATLELFALLAATPPPS